jgi:hypothetical protein
VVIGGFAAAALAMAPPVATQDAFEAAAGAYAGCMTEIVRMGMTVKMAPDEFKAGFDKSCKAEEAAFRAAAIAQAKALGRSDAEAAAEVDGNIARGKAAWAADEAAYVRTHQVPR